MISFLRSVGCALSGIVHASRTQRHMQVHLIAALLVIAAALYFRLSAAEWIVVLLLSALVIAAELFNTAIENVVDLASPEQHPLAKAAKDTAAGAVLVLAIIAIAIGLIIFGPHVRDQFLG
ncbi:diacylglycerol kinase family protein [Paenibacillus oenotherae]|uniref:Diacylglycerol kinase family protein n=1 Tax=Paenibacillus oenotherae TaxID=1435645 RepID=A0ABS7D181_9BACL|nr:diacylglycerol kinase family protein [Paenibacillus oenotherae]MBW7473702.1 diacylglycerol kinase family protein [Paenibacillus oenotherae]